jgi:4-carboxymuconolactone decarboxylase
MARIPYPDTPDMSVRRLPAPLNAFRMMSHSVVLTPHVVDLGLAILAEGALPPRTREQVIMLVAAVCRCPYEVAQHSPIALDAGVTAGQLSAIADGRLDAAAFTPDELVALRAAKELAGTHTWSSQTLTALRNSFTYEEMVELALTVGYYVLLAGLMNGLDIDVDPAGGRFTTLANRR